MTVTFELVLGLLSAANLIGVSGLWYRLGSAITNYEHVSRRQNLMHRGYEDLAERVTRLEHQGSVAT